MLLTSPNRWTSKPPPGTDLDRTHSLCPDHCWPILSPYGKIQNLARYTPLKEPISDVYVASSSIVPGRKYGLSIRHGATTDIGSLTAVLTPEVAKIVPDSGGFTILIAHRKTDGTARVNAAFGMQTSGITTERCDAYLRYNDGNSYWCYGGVTTGVNTVTVSNSVLTFGDDLWTFTTGPRGMEMWQNGIIVGSHTGNPTKTNTQSNNLFALSSFTPGLSELADTALVMTWRRQLTKSEVISISNNPWQVFQYQNFFTYQISAADPSGAFDISGSATVSFNATSIAAASFAVNGSSILNFVSTLIQSSVFSSVTSGVVSFEGAYAPRIASSDFAIPGIATINFGGSVVFIVTDIKIKLLDGTWTSLIY